MARAHGKSPRLDLSWIGMVQRPHLQQLIKVEIGTTVNMEVGHKNPFCHSLHRNEDASLSANLARDSRRSSDASPKPRLKSKRFLLYIILVILKCTQREWAWGKRKGKKVSKRQCLHTKLLIIVNELHISTQFDIFIALVKRESFHCEDRLILTNFHD